MISKEQFIHHIRGCFYNQRDSQKFIFELYESYASRIGECYASDNKELTEIITHGFLLAFRNFPHHHSKEMHDLHSFRTWLRKWILCGVVSYCRAHFLHRRLLSFKHLTQNNPSVAWNNFFSKHCPQFHGSGEEVFRILHTLSPADRIILNLTVLEGFKPEEIAGCFNISLETAARNVSKAILQIQKASQCTHLSGEAFLYPDRPRLTGGFSAA